MRWHRWRVVARDVNGREIEELGRSRFEMRARGIAATHRAYVVDVDPGHPLLYGVTHERIAR